MESVPFAKSNRTVRANTLNTSKRNTTNKSSVSHSHSFPKESSLFRNNNNGYFDPNSSSSSSGFSYTSLKDIMDSSSSPSGGQSLTCFNVEITISNRLVEKAAWSYLRPMPADMLMENSSPRTHFVCLIWKPLYEALKRMTRIVGRLIGVILD